jgi:hypothetical protein
MSRCAAHFSIFLYLDQDCTPAKLESKIRDVSCLGSLTWLPDHALLRVVAGKVGLV